MEVIERETPVTTVLVTTVLMGPNCYQISWYSDRRCRPLPSDRTLGQNQSSLAAHLAGVDYVLVTSFERGQPRYIRNDLRRIEREQGGRVETFSDPRFWTAIVPASAFHLRPSANATGVPRDM
jgi:hypothetical protein